MTLNEEISSFLKNNGFACQSDNTAGFCSIKVTCPSGAERHVLPVCINATTIEEAEEQRKRTSDIPDSADRPIVITEDLWRRRPEMMRRRLLAHLEVFHSIYARNCEIRRIEKAEAAAFLEANHSYGDASCRYRYGMFLKRYTGHTLHNTSGKDSTKGISTPSDWDSYANVICRQPENGMPATGTLVAVAEFSNARKWLKGDKEIRSYEWTRYASLAGVRICGGMGRMLNHFISQVHPDDIMSYADLEWSDGSVYRQLGFIQETGKGPVTFRIDPSTWERRPVTNSRTAILPTPQPAAYNARPDAGCTPTESAGKSEGNAPLYFQNFGSLKYRLKLTGW